MKYLAILRDSVREALDSKVLYVNLVLTGLFLLFIASISFRFLTVKEEMETRASQLNTLFSLQGQSQGVDASCHVEDFQQLNDASEKEPWKGVYRFTFVLTLSEAVPDMGRLPFRNLLEQSVRQGFLERFNSVRVTTLPPRNKKEFRLGVECGGSYVKDSQHWNHIPVLFFGGWSLHWLMNSPAQIAYVIEDWLANWIVGTIIILLGVIVTAYFVPNMLRRGSVELLLSKPITRTRLLIFKYLGGLVFVLVNAAVVVLGCYLVVGLRAGIWAQGFLLIIPLLTFFFAILYAVSVLVAVLTRSTVLSILLACLTWLVLVVLGFLQDWANPERGGKPDVPAAVSGTIKGLHTVLPRTRQLVHLTTDLLQRELIPATEREKSGTQPVQASWGEALGVSAVWIVLLLGLASWRFTDRDH
jgi:hypothetical protein